MSPSPLVSFRTHSWDRSSRLLTATELTLESATGDIVTGMTAQSRLSPHSPSWAVVDARGWHELVVSLRWWDYTVDSEALTRAVSVMPVDFHRSDLMSGPDGLEVMQMIPNLYVSESLVFEKGSPWLVPGAPVRNKAILREPDQADPYFMLYVEVGEREYLLQSVPSETPEDFAVDAAALGMSGFDIMTAAKDSASHVDYLVAWAEEHVGEEHECDECARRWKQVWRV